MKPHFRPRLDIFAALVLVLILFAPPVLVLVLGSDGYPRGGAVDVMIGDEVPLLADAVDGLAVGYVTEVSEDCV